MSSNPKPTLHTLKVHDTALILGFQGSSTGHRQRLLAMGLTPGTTFTVTRIAPLGDPIEISLRGYALCIRKCELATLKLERASS